MFKHYFIITIYSIFHLSGSILGMQHSTNHLKQIVVGSKMARIQSWGRIVAGVGTGIALAGFLSNKEDLFEQKPVLDSVIEVDPLVEQFIRQQLAACGLKDQESLHIIKARRWGGSAQEGKKIISVAEHDRLKECLVRQKYVPSFFSKIKTFFYGDEQEQSIKKSTDEYLKQAAAVVHHEGGHILNGDRYHLWYDNGNFIYEKELYYGLAVGVMLSPFALLLKCKKVSWPIFIFFTTIVGPESVAREGAFRYSQYRESRADSAIADNIHLLKAFKNRLKDHYLLHTKFYDKDSRAHSHPHPTVRIKRLKERIKLLKAKGDPRAFEDPLAIKEKDFIK